MTIGKAATLAGVLAASAGMCGSVSGQARDASKESGPYRIRDGDWVFPGAGTCSKAQMARLLFGSTRQPEDPVGDGYACDVAEATDVLNCNLDVELIPSTSTITGSNTFTIVSKVDGLNTFTFRLRSQFAISSAIINGTTPVTVSSLSTTTRQAALDRAYNNGEIFTLKISYSGVPQSAGSFGSVQFTTQNGQPLFQTLSEPYYSYTWWPCKDGDAFAAGDNSDKFTSQVSITAPNTLTSVSNGLLQGVDAIAGNKNRYRWATNYQTATYLVFINCTAYNQWQDTYTYPLAGGGTGTMPVQFSIYPANDNSANRASWEKCLQMLATYRPYYGEYPFVNEKYGIYNFNFSGGQEHQTYTGEGTFSENITAHELGHQWWGDNVTCKTWGDIWLNEGFATFTESMWIQYKPGSTGWPAYFSAVQARRPGDVSQAVYRYDLSSASTIFDQNFAYDKGGWALHTLRGVLGDTTFWASLAAYRAAFQGSGATTDDFKSVVSSVYGQDMTWFFQEWIYGIGAPAYASGWQTVTIGGQSYLKLRVRQTQLATYPLFTMPINVRITTTAGTQYAKIWNNAGTQWFMIPINAPATGFALDQAPEGGPWILETANSNEAFVNGPPKIIGTSVAPGTFIQQGSSPSQISVSFSEDVNAPTAAFTLTGPTGAVPLNVSYNNVTLTSTLDAGSPLAPGIYTLSVSDSITSTAASIALDGEVGNPPPPAPPRLAPFPSGDGVAGGVATWTFTVEGSSCYANCDQSTSTPILNVSDFTCFLQRFAQGDPYANCDGSTTVPVLNVNDFTCFLQKFAQGCP